MKITLAAVTLLVGAAVAAGAACQTLTPEPDVPAPWGGPTLYTATGVVRVIRTDGYGGIWAATAGGVLHWTIPGSPDLARRWTTAERLASNDVRGLLPPRAPQDAATVLTPTAAESVAPHGSTIAPAGDGLPPGAELRDAARTSDADYLGTSAGLFRRPLAEHVWRRVNSVDEPVWKVAADGDGVSAATAGGIWRVSRARSGVREAAYPAGADAGAITALAPVGGGGLLLATAIGLWRRGSAGWREVGLPAGGGSHVSAAAPDGGGGLSVGVYGDGIYRLTFDRRGRPDWRRLPGQPGETARVTALAPLPSGGLAVGTAGSGVVTFRVGRWRALSAPGNLSSADIYAVAEHEGLVYAATFDAGLIALDRQGRARHEGVSEGMSSPSVRQFVRFRGRLYARHTTGALDVRDGDQWQPAFPPKTLPRPQVFSAAVDARGQRLALGGWAGWAAFEGERWEHHWNEPELAGQVVTAVAPEPAGGAVWIGTQKRGLFRYENGRYEHFHEAHGLTDDWITALAVRDGRVLVGTYTGGLLELADGRAARILDTSGMAVRSVEFLPDGRPAAATPLGVFAEGGDGIWRPLDPQATGGLEAQALCVGADGLWVGTRTSLALVR